MVKNNSTLKIALIGMGVAGNARIRALESLSQWKLAGTVSRRSDVGTLQLEELWSNPQISAVAISTENTSHEAIAGQALKAGKHVLVDYPLALTFGGARDLKELAKKQNRVLHVEHIGLLTEGHRTLKAEAQALGPIEKGDYLFQGGFNSKLSDANRSGPPHWLALSRLVQIGDLFGPFKLKVREYRQDQNGFTLHLHLHFPKGGVLGFTEERREGLPRRRTLTAQCEKGPIAWKMGVGSEGLFGKDLRWFHERITENKPCYYDEEMMVDIIGQLEGLKV